MRVSKRVYSTALKTALDAAGNTDATGIFNSLSVPAGKLMCFELRGDVDGTLHRLYVKQASGTSVAYTVEVLDAPWPYTPGADFAYNASPAYDLGLFRVIASQSALAGAAVDFRSEQGAIFRNMTRGAGSGTEARILYLVIAPTASIGVASTWDVSVASSRNDS